MSAAFQPRSIEIDPLKNQAPLSPSMVDDLPIVTQFDQHAAQSILATNSLSADPVARDRATHSSRRRKKTRVKSREARDESVFQPGSRLVDRYEVLRKIGQGGMSLVYEAIDEVRNEHVALKVLLPQLAAKPKLQQRFLQEGRLSSNFSHANIARVYDLHQTDSLIMLSMELLQGSTLRHDMERRKNQRQCYRPSEVLSTIQQVCRALCVVHASDVIHRDLKPENLWLGLDETVKVMDFGIARDSMRAAYTTGPRGSGTPYYIAPEQLSASPSLDHRADQYSLAVIAYEMLTGDIPQGVIHPPHATHPGIPRKLSLAIFRAMNSDPAKRFPDVEAFAEAARYRIGISPWMRAGMIGGGMLLMAGSALGFQYGLLPLLESKPSPVWASVATQTTFENDEVSFICRHPESTLSGQNLTFKLLSDAPVGSTIDAATGKFVWTPTEAQGPQTYSFKVMAIVQQEGQAPVVEEQPFSVVVDERFDAPKMETPDAVTVKEHALLKVQLMAEDINVPAVGLRYELLEAPAGMSVDARTGILQWTPQENDGGSNHSPVIRVSLDSDEHLDAAITRKLNVRVDESIEAPTFTSPSRLQATVGEPTRFRFASRDPNTPEINRYYRLRNGDRMGMSVDPQSGELYWTPTEAQAGKEFELIAEIGWDGSGKSETLSEQTVKVVVAELKPDPKDDAKSEAKPASVETVAAAASPAPAAPTPAPAPASTTCPSNPQQGGSGQGGLGGNPGQAGQGNSTNPTCPSNGQNKPGQGNNGNQGQANRQPLPVQIPWIPPALQNGSKPTAKPNPNQGIRVEDLIKRSLQNEVQKFKQKSRQSFNN